MACIRIDVRGQLCPMPVIKAQQAVKKAAAGDEIIVLATDPGAEHDIPAFCEIFELTHDPRTDIIKYANGDIEFHIFL